MSDATVDFALVGCGRVGHRYLEVFDGEVRGGRLAEVCDVVPERAEEFASRSGARAWTDMERLLAESGAHCVCFATPSGAHADHIEKALMQGRHVVVEKPFTMRMEDARRLTALAAEQGRMLAVMMQNRYNPAMRKVKETMDSGRFGRPVLGTVRVRWSRDMSYYSADDWRGKWLSDGGVITNQAVHHIDALRWILGPVEAVCAAGTARLNAIEVDDTTVGVVRFASGALGVVEATTGTRPEDIEASLSVLGEGGTVVVGDLALNEIQTWQFVSPQPGDDEAAQRFSQAVPNAYGFGHAPLLQDVIDALSEGRIDHPVDGHEAQQGLAVVHALYRSMEVGGWVSMADDPLSERLGIGA